MYQLSKLWVERSSLRRGSQQVRHLPSLQHFPLLLRLLQVGALAEAASIPVRGDERKQDVVRLKARPSLLSGLQGRLQGRSREQQHSLSRLLPAQQLCSDISWKWNDSRACLSLGVGP